ncbi:alpha/beta fold hydrolase [Megalodesulfovibrio gigas]|uniref:AB hydrolase-1 domain-containing protein n=1 Tax=Megalodesulfovibrio gigas (strain ATCC 19364 / DSM 1382 / NCIMB 9332 / VKM B-1759) TaxID=1121448 RepID=T2G7N8_MEGG1|nr:alpha/beta fold hydrolase [Megalodesulfovibrio gigas]AGW12308.1 hypothetical protein DGI_0389 [Megalodesulfovibrio gigas DSM 1382 = ATCC 19364]
MQTVQTTTAAGEPVVCRERGTGEVLLFISGWGGDAVSWEAEFVWFGSRLRCLTLEHPGLAGIPAPDGPLGTADMADRIARGLAAMGITAVTALGMSMGGAVAQELALRHPQLVQKLVLSGTFPRMDVRAGRALDACTRLLAGPDRVAALQMIYWMIFGASFHAANLQALDALLESRLDSPVPLEVFQYQAAACIAHDTTARLGQIACPTLVTHGTADLLVDVSHARQLAAGIPQARLVEFPGAGHCHLWEEPARYRQVVLEFVDAAC